MNNEFLILLVKGRYSGFYDSVLFFTRESINKLKNSTSARQIGVMEVLGRIVCGCSP